MKKKTFLTLKSMFWRPKWPEIKHCPLTLLGGLQLPLGYYKFTSLDLFWLQQNLSVTCLFIYTNTNILQCKKVIQKIKHFGLFLNVNEKNAFSLATTELQIWKLLDILKSLLSIDGMKLMIIFLLIVLS